MRRLPPSRPSEPYLFDRYPPGGPHPGVVSIATVAVFAALVLLSMSPYLFLAGLSTGAAGLVALRAAASE